MAEFTITVSYVVDARDHDEAVEIAKDVVSDINDGCALMGHGWKLRNVETSTIEETG